MNVVMPKKKGPEWNELRRLIAKELLAAKTPQRIVSEGIYARSSVSRVSIAIANGSKPEHITSILGVPNVVTTIKGKVNRL
jgi:hypothetical protein